MPNISLFLKQGAGVQGAGLPKQLLVTSGRKGPFR